MLTLGMTTAAETFTRLREPLAARGIRVEHVETEGAFPLDGAPARSPVDVGFVYPSRTMAGGVVDALLGVPWVNDRTAVLRSRNKAAVIARLRRADLPVPETVLLASPVDEAALRTAFDRVGPPAVIKPNSATRGTGLVKVDDIDSLLGVADYLDLLHEFPPTRDRTFLVQEFLPDATDYRAMVVDGTFVGAVERRLAASDREAGRWKHNVHRGAEATGVDLPPTLRELVEAAAEAVAIPWIGVDLLVTDDGPVVTETNARPTVDAATKYEDGFYDRLATLIERTATAGT